VLLAAALVLLVVWLNRRADHPRTPHGDDHGDDHGDRRGERHGRGRSAGPGARVGEGTAGTAGPTSNALTAAERETPGSTGRGSTRPPAG
jgi:hypothetical protein